MCWFFRSLQEVGILILSVKFLSSEVVLCFIKYTGGLCLKYFYYVFRDWQRKIVTVPVMLVSLLPPPPFFFWPSWVVFGLDAAKIRKKSRVTFGLSEKRENTALLTCQNCPGYRIDCFHSGVNSTLTFFFVGFSDSIINYRYYNAIKINKD